MAQTKKKTSTKTAKKPATRTQARKKTATKTKKCRDLDPREKMHIYIVTAMSMIAGLLLCTDATIMAFAM